MSGFRYLLIHLIFLTLYVCLCQKIQDSFLYCSIHLIQVPAQEKEGPQSSGLHAIWHWSTELCGDAVRITGSEASPSQTGQTLHI